MAGWAQVDDALFVLTVILPGLWAVHRFAGLFIEPASPRDLPVGSEGPNPPPSTGSAGLRGDGQERPGSA